MDLGWRRWGRARRWLWISLHVPDGGGHAAGARFDGHDSALGHAGHFRKADTRIGICSASFFRAVGGGGAERRVERRGFTVSGTWRQQFDWAVIEWNRDNVYEHPVFRNLPDGDLSGLTLTYRRDADELHSAGFGFVSRLSTGRSLRVWGARTGRRNTIYLLCR